MPLFHIVYLVGVAVAFGVFIFGLGGVWLWMAVLEQRERGVKAAAGPKAARAELRKAA